MDDPVESALSQWRRERPDLDPSAMGTVGRLLRAATLLGAGIDRLAAEHGLTRGEGDVLLTLRRSGAPYRLKPSELARTTLVTPGGMTSRLDGLERAGLVRRRPGADDRRVLEVELTAKGRRLTDRVLPDHVASEERMLAGLGKRERTELNRLLAKLLAGLEPG